MNRLPCLKEPEVGVQYESTLGENLQVLAQRLGTD